MEGIISSLTLAFNDIASSGTIHHNKYSDSSGTTYKQHRTVFKCECCGATEIYNDECNYCGAWYGKHAKPKREEKNRIKERLENLYGYPKAKKELNLYERLKKIIFKC